MVIYGKTQLFFLYFSELSDIPRFKGEENDTDYFKVLLQEGSHMLVGAK